MRRRPEKLRERAAKLRLLADRLDDEACELIAAQLASADFVPDPADRSADRILALLRRNPSVSFSPIEIAEACVLAPETVKKALAALLSTGEIERSSHGRYRWRR